MKEMYDGFSKLPCEQIFDFDSGEPPVVCESMLREAAAKTAEKAAEQRQLRGRIALLAAAGLLIIIAAVLSGFMTIEVCKPVSFMCFAYAALSVAACGLLAFIFMRKGGIEI